MKKWIAAAFLVLILAAAGIPFARGIAVKGIVEDSVKDINQMYQDSGMGMNVNVSSYDRNFLTSRIEWELDLGTLSTLYGIEAVKFVENVNHGFTRTVSTTSLEKNNWYSDFVDQKLSGRDPLSIVNTYQVSGAVESEWTVDGFSFVQEGKTVDVSTGKMTLNLDGKMKHIRSEVSWKGMEVPEEFGMENLAMTSGMKRISGRIWEGNASCRIEKVRAADGQTRLAVDQLAYEMTPSFDKSANAVSIEVMYGADRIEADGRKIEDASMKVAVNHVDADRYEAFLQLYSEAVADVLENVDTKELKNNGSVNKAVERQMGRAGTGMAAACEKLLTKGLEIRISDVQARFPQGDVNGNIMLKLKKDMTFMQFLPIAARPSAALDIFSLKSDFRLPYRMVPQQQALLAPAYPGMQTGFFVKEGEDLVHEAETREGKLFLNGKEVRLQ